MSGGNSRVIRSAQTACDERLPKVLARHRITVFKKPILAHNVSAFQLAMARWQGHGPLVLDTGCGVGESSLRLARMYPESFVVGVDQSADRLGRDKARLGPAPDNLCLVRADLVDFWRLLRSDGVRLARHYFLYPNPWPKLGHLGRRWHGHPIFPLLPELGGIMECRSNWRVYVEEFAWALGCVTGRSVECERWEAAVPLTPFERKYKASGHALFRCVLDLGA